MHEWTKGAAGWLVIGAAVGVASESLERAEALVAAGVDVLVLDAAHGHSANVLRMARTISERWDVPLVVGNVATAEGAEAVIEAGADAVKAGIGAGAICTTRVVAGVGVPQVTAVYDCVRAASRHDVPVIADCGI